MGVFSRSPNRHTDPTKTNGTVEDHELDGQDGSPRLASEARDQADMAKLGIRQETKRRFGLLTILAFTSTMMCSWESAYPFFVPAFINGGGVTMVWGFVFAFTGSLATCASMAEMASMYPISGGQYHWVALLAPPKWANFLSWLTGWVSTIGWQAAASTGTYLCGNIIQALAALNNPEYTPTRWQATLIMYAILALTVLVNTLFVKYLPDLEGVVLILHVIGFFAIMIPLVDLAPISSASFVFTEFTNLSGYPSNGLSFLIGQAAIAILFIGYDGACHMAEETKDAALNVPRAMFFTMFVNGSLGFATLIVILYCFGDVETTMSSPLPFIQIFYNGTQSLAGASVMTCILLFMYTAATFGFLASASRQAWAFARDNGLPFSNVFKRIDNSYAVPMYAIAFTSTINALLGLVNVGSSVAFNAIVSLVVAGFFSSYLIAVSLMMLKRLRNEPVELGPWNLGRFGLPINIYAVAYTTLTVVMSFFPPAVPVTAVSMNYSCVMFGGTVLLGIIYYVARGHKVYKKPIVYANLRR